MGRDPKKRQKALERKRARRKQKQTRRPVRSTGRALLHQAGTWPIHEVLLSEGWDEEGALVQILVARRSLLGQIAVGSFLVDPGCLGVKSAFARFFKSQGEYEQTLRRKMMSSQPMQPADLNLVAKIVREGIAYARQLGFSPDPDYREAMLVVGDADPDASRIDVPVGGKDGKPFYMAGPYDDVSAIMDKLMQTFGPDGFHYLVPASPDTEVLVDDDWLEEEEGDEE
jgi:hypothetical protein